MSSIKPVDHAKAWAEAIVIAASLYNQAELHVWLHAPQSLVGNWTPLQMLGCGKGDELLRVMQSLEEGAFV